MKLIQTFEGMSMNSLKPSINSEPESSLDSCMMKEVDDCLLSKDLLSQNNGAKELCVTDFEIGSVGNTPKKMFEQVDLNSSLPGSEVSHKKDSWSPIPLFNKTSEKENMVEPSEEKFDILSDDDDNDSIHLKISSDDENSNPDSDTNDLSSSSCKPLLDCNDEISQNALDGVEIGDAICTDEDYCLSANNISESSEEITVDNIISNDNKESLVQNEGETEAKSTLGTETEHEDTSEELEPQTPCSDSPELSVNENSCNASETMVNEVKTHPTSPKSFNAKRNLETSDTNLEISDEKSPINSDKDRVCAQEASQCDGSLQQVADNNVEPEIVEKYESPSDDIIQQEQKTQVQLTSDHSNSEDTSHSSFEKEVIPNSDDAVISDNKEVDDTNEEMDEGTKTDEAIINDKMQNETVSNEKMEEINCEITEDAHGANSADTNDSVKEVEEIDHEITEGRQSPNRAEVNDPVKKTEEIDCEVKEGMESPNGAEINDSDKEVEETDCEITEGKSSPNSAEMNDSVKEVEESDCEITEGMQSPNSAEINDSVKEVEEMDCEITDDTQSPNSAEINNSLKKMEETDCENTEDAPSPNSAETSDSVKEGKLVNEDDALNESFENLSTVKNDTGEKFLEILEYQPISEEVDELKDIQSDKEMSFSEIEPISSVEDENACELPVPVELTSDKTTDEQNLSSIQKDGSENLDNTPDEIDTVSVNSMKPHSNENSECEEQVSIEKKSESSAKRNFQRLDSSENEGVSMENDSECDAEEDKEEHELESETTNATKAELPTENCEAKTSRKRASNYEENLVNLKRTKVAVSESEASDECDVFVCEQSRDSEPKRIDKIVAKEKTDSRVKRLSNSVSDAIDAKKIRVLSETSQVEKEKETKGDESDDKKIELETDNKRNVDSNSESSKPEELKINSLPFLRNISRSQLKNLTRNDLEELVLQKICEAITERSQCGQLRELAQTLEQKIKAWQKKSFQLTKQVKDLNLVLKRYSSDLQTKGPNAMPVKITRSVGLQVQMPGSSNGNWFQEEGSRRKGDKPSSSASTSAPSSGPTPVKTCTPSPTKPATANVPKVAEASDNQGPSGPPRSNSATVPQTVGGAKVLAPKTPTSSNPVSPNVKQFNNKQLSSTANNKPKSSPDLQVIDLTDHEEKIKTSTNRASTVSNTPTTTSATSVPVSVATTVISPATSSNSVANVNAGCRSIRVVQHLSNSTPVLTQTVTNTVAGQRVAYFVPTTSVPVQQRQLIISSSSQIRPAGVISMSQRQNPLPTILLKPGQVVPVSPAGASGGSIIRTTTVSNQLQLATRPQPRAGQLFPRFQSPIQSSSLSVVQSSGLSVSSVSHPAPLPPIPPTMTSSANMKLPPPKPDLKISKVPNRNQQGIVLSWNMTVTNEYEEIASYQLFAYQEGSAPPSTQLWKKVGDVKALPLPMACTLTQFMEGHKYHFAVRAVDVYARYGPFSAPGNIVLTRN